MKMQSALPYCLLAAAAAIAGCSSAEKCTRGQEACAPRTGAALRQDGACDDGLVLTRGVCVDDPSGGIRDAGPPGPVACSSASLEVACERFCAAFCRNEDNLCVQSRCPADTCDRDFDPNDDEQTVYEACIDRCGSDPNPGACGNMLCEAEGERTCEDFGFEHTTTGVFIAGCFEDDPVCVLNENYGCSDTCGTLPNNTNGDLAGNDVCEDGGEDSVDPKAPACPRGTDCTDCGPRVCSKANGRCEGHGDCCDFYGGGAFCVDLDEVGGTCLATCTETRTCPQGFRCSAVDDNQNFVCAPQ